MVIFNLALKLLLILSTWCNFAVTSYTNPIILKDNGHGNGVTYLIHKKGY